MHHHAWLQILSSDFIYLFFAVLGIEPRGILPPHYTPGPIFFILYFETGSHEVAEGLTKERERERETETERELRLATNPDPQVSASQSTRITSVRHHARPPTFI